MKNKGQAIDAETQLRVFESIYKKSIWLILLGAIGLSAVLLVPVFYFLMHTSVGNHSFSLSGVYVFVSLFLLLIGVVIRIFSKKEMQKLRFKIEEEKI